MMGKREIAMKLLIALAVGLMLAGPLAAQDGDEEATLSIVLQELLLLAEQGDGVAQIKFARMYHFGSGVPRDYAEAAQWFRLAAEQGHDAAQFLLGLMYYNGDGVPQDAVLAHTWYNISAANGFALGSQNRGKIEKRMTPEQIAEAQALARRCMASNYQDCD